MGKKVGEANMKGSSPPEETPEAFSVGIVMEIAAREGDWKTGGTTKCDPRWQKKKVER